MRARARPPGDGNRLFDFRVFWRQLSQVPVNPDTNGDCLISDAEAKTAARQTVKNLEAFFAQVSARFDTDGDGVLNEDEAGRINNLLAENGRKRPRFLDWIDKNGDWNLSDKEADAAERILISRYNRQNQIVLRRCDKNGDGRLDEAEQAEAQKLLEQMRKRLGAGERRIGRRRGKKGKRRPW